MAKINKALTEVRIPLGRMTFTPDVPSSALEPNEYNQGINIETDIRNIRQVAGDEEIIAAVPGTPTFITGGFRQSGSFWFIVATVEGKWWATDGTVAWQDITPDGATFTGYSQAINITESWNGPVPIFNDTINPPFFLPDEPGATMTMYSNRIPPNTITDIIYVSPTTMKIQLASPYDTPPFAPGDKISITDVDVYFNGVFTVASSTTTTIDYLANPLSTYPAGNQGTVQAAYTWNYNPLWESLSAGFIRMYSTPNVGNILVAGDLTARDYSGVETKFPVTVQWSQAFGLNEAPLTWVQSLNNVANQLEVPLRGTALDAFPSNGQFFICSYWDTVVFTPINYATTSAPILGVRLYNQGRGLLSSNCWASTDKMVYGVDARDIWVFNGQDFQGIGNQRVKNWFYDQLNPAYVDRVFMENNSQRNQIEIYYPDAGSATGVPNKMISYRYDIDCWNAPREVASATFACESPIWIYNSLTGGWDFNPGSRTIVYARGETDSQIVQKDHGYSFIATPENPTGAIVSQFRRDNIKLLPNYSGKLMVHRILPEAYNLGAEPFTGTDERQITPSTGHLHIRVEGADSVGSSPVVSAEVQMQLDTSEPWAQIDQNARRVNSIELSNTSTTDVWGCNAITWQFTEVEDDR